MNITDETPPHYARMPGVHPRARKRIFHAHKTSMDGEDATQAITIGYMIDREKFIDSLPDVVCYDGIEGLEQAFREWLAEQKR